MPHEPKEPGQAGEFALLSDAEKAKRFKEIEQSIYIGPKEVMELFALFGEPPEMIASPDRHDEVIFKYPLGDIFVDAEALIKQDREQKLIRDEELAEPWAFSPTGKWDGPYSNTTSVIAYFSLDRVPGSDFIKVVIDNYGMGFPPRIKHEYFDLLEKSVREAIIEKIKPTIPTPEKSAAEKWARVERNPMVKKWREIKNSLFIPGEPVWHKKGLYIGQRKVDLNDFHIHRDDKLYGLDAKAALEELKGTAQYMLDEDLDPLRGTFVPTENEPLLGINDVQAWRAEYAAAFNGLKERSGWDTIDQARLRHLNKAIEKSPENIIGHIDLSTRKQATPKPAVGFKSERPSTAPATEASKENLKKLDVDSKGWFECDKGHASRAGKGDRDRLKAGQRIELFCSNCNKIVGYAE